MASEASTEQASRRVTQAELARELAVSRQAVADLVKRQVLTLDADGRVAIDHARAIIAERIRPSAKTASAPLPTSAATTVQPATAPAPPATPPAAPPAAPHAPDTITSYHVARTLREAAEANIAQLRLAQMSGALIDRDAATQAAFTAFRTLRDNLSYIPRRVAGQIAAMTTARDVQMFLEDALRETLDSYQKLVLAGLVQRMGAPVQGADIRANHAATAGNSAP